MNRENKIKVENLATLDFDNIPNGPNYIIDGEDTVAVLMSIEYYEYLEQLMFKLRDKIVASNKPKK